MLERFTDRARRVLVLAREEARELHHPFIGTEHILLGLLRESGGLAAKALESLDISLDAVRAQVEEMIGPVDVSPVDTPPFTPRVKKVLELSRREALELGHKYVGTEHLLLGLAREAEGVGAQVLNHFGADLERVRATVLSVLSGGPSSESVSVGGSSPGSRWPHYPTRILSGPVVRIEVDGLEFSVTGVLVYEHEVEVFWRLAGIPRAIADVIKDTDALSPAGERDGSAAYVTLSDDRGTDYSLEEAGVALRPDCAFVGRSRFAPAPPRVARYLNVRWQGESIAVEL